MKILFVENRYKTYLWEIVGEEYLKLGHEIHFIVQNHCFIPKNSKFKVHRLKYPFSNKENLIPSDTEKYKKIIKSNRGLKYFGIEYNGFIAHYGKQIEKLVTNINPDIAFGESTLFHELLIIDACKARDILYLNPSSSRYPKNRFVFYKHDTLEPYKGSKEILPKIDAESLAFSIGKRESLPDYMNQKLQRIKISNLFNDKIKLIRGYYSGEKYNTPSPFAKCIIENKSKKNIKYWEYLSSDLDISKFNIMYPLQMQPEANIDVWGYPYCNQAQIVEWIINNLTNGEQLVIKPNPKSKYEISKELINVIKMYPEKVCVLSHKVKMSDVWDEMDFVITVTGTVSIECIFDDKPVAMFGLGIQRDQKNCLSIDFDSNLSSITTKIRMGNFPRLTKEEKGEFVNKLLSTSYEGINGDGLHNMTYLNDNVNLNKLLHAYKSVIKPID